MANDAVGRRANADDIPGVAACLASAFYDDPLWGRWTFPDEDARARDLLRFMTLMAEMGQAGGVFTQMADGAGSVTVWTPPGARYGEPGFDERIDDVLATLFGPRAAELQALFEQFDAHMPGGEFHHLEWWATRRDRAGEGLGTRLLNEDLRRVDAAHAASYLESTNPVNIPRYEALGFRPVGEFGPPGGPIVTTMWRQPR
jgi:GNAT superfamily N-acetyltransferase